MEANHPNGRAFCFEGGPHGCLLLHGFTGTPGHMRYLGEGLRDAGYSVSAPMLPGHGETLEAMSKSNWAQWLGCARNNFVSLAARCDRVSVIGLSMGGALALILAEEYPVASVSCLSAAIRLRSRFSWAGGLIAPLRPYSDWAADERSAEGRGILLEYDVGYRGMPLSKVRDLKRIMRLAERNLFAVVAPALVIQPERDETVDPKGANVIMGSISSRDKQLIWLGESGHVCTIGCEREQVLYSVLKHLHNVDATKSLAI